MSEPRPIQIGGGVTSNGEILISITGLGADEYIPEDGALTLAIALLRAVQMGRQHPAYKGPVTEISSFTASFEGLNERGPDEQQR